MADQILLYRSEPVVAPLHFIRIVNPLFANTTAVPGDWWQPSGEWTWLGLGYAQYAYNGAASAIVQQFANPPIEGTYYDVNFTISNATQGALDVYMGIDLIGTFDNGTHSVLYCTSSGDTLAGKIYFRPVDDGGWFNGRVDSVSIVQNAAHRAAPTEYRYEPASLLDMMPDETVGITMRVGDVKSLNKRFGAFTRSFVIPGTPSNKKALGHLHTHGANPRVFDPKNKTKAVLLCETIPALTGYLSLKDVTTVGDRTEYEIEMFDNSFGLLDAIKGKTLADLDLTDWAHRLTIDNVVGSWSATSWNSHFFYPLYPVYGVDYALTDHFRPAYFHRAILDRIIQQAGFSYSVSDDIDAMSDQLLHSPVGKKPAAPTSDLFEERIRASSDRDQAWLSPSFSHDEINSIDAAYTRATWQANIEEVDPGGNYDPSTYTFTAKYSGPYTLTMNIRAQVAVNTGNYPVTMGTLLNGESPNLNFIVVDPETDMIVAKAGGYYVPSELSGPINQTIDFTASTQTLELTAGQKVVLQGAIGNSGIYAYTNLFSSTFIRPGMSLAIDDSASWWSIQPTEGAYPVAEGMSVVAADWLGKIKQEDFINDTIKLFNGYLVPDTERERMIHIRSRTDLYGTDKVLDRTNRIDLDAEIKQEYLTEVSSSILRLAYKAAGDKDELNARYTTITGKEYGEKQFSFSTDLYGVDTADIRLACYTPSPIIRDSSGRFLPGVFLNATDSTNKLLVKATGATSSPFTVRYYDELAQSAATRSFDSYYPCLHTDALGSGSTFDVNFGEVSHVLTNEAVGITDNNLFNANYADQLAQYRDGRLFSAMMRLTPAEVKEHRENIGARIYTKELGWSILYSIIDWDPRRGNERTTKVQLLECGPTEKNLRVHTISYAEMGSATLNPILEGTVNGPTVLTQSGSQPPTNVWNNNTGNNVVGGTFNNSSGSGNTIGQNTTFVDVRGFNNTVDAGLSGVTVFGGTRVHVTESNSTYFPNGTSFTASGATFFGQSGTTIGPNITSFYGPSGVSITHGTINIGGSTGLTFSTTGVTVNGETIDFQDTKVQDGINTYTAGTPSHPSVNVVASPSFTSVSAITFFSGSTDLSKLLTGGTGTRIIAGTNIVTAGTPSAVSVSTTLNPVFSAVSATTRFNVGAVVVAASGITVSGATLQGLPTGTDGQLLYNTSGVWGGRDLGIRASSNATDWFRYGGENNSVTTGSLWSGIVGGFFNQLAGYAISSTVVGGALNTLSLGAGNLSSSILNSHSSTMLSASTSTIVAGATNTIEGGASSAMIGGENNVIKESSLSFLGGGNANQISASTFGFASFSTIIGGATNRNFDSNKSAIIGGDSNTLSGATGSAIIAASGVTGTRGYTLYTNAIEIQQVLDLKPLTGATPTAREGRVYYSGGTGLMVCTGNTSADWRRVALI